MWLTIERYHEVVTNFLGLVSFLLVTPELLRICQPSIKSFTVETGRIFFLLGAPVLVVLALHTVLVYCASGANVPEQNRFAWLIIFAASFVTLCFLYFISRLLKKWNTGLAEKIGHAIAYKAFAFGIGLFIATRIFGIAVGLLNGSNGLQ